jgi:hypothetical protein
VSFDKAGYAGLVVSGDRVPQSKRNSKWLVSAPSFAKAESSASHDRFGLS